MKEPDPIRIRGGAREHPPRRGYACRHRRSLLGTNAINIGGIVAERVTFSGAGTTRIGLPLAEITVDPTELPLGEVAVAFAGSTLEALGG